jgi:hypothetical protein
VSRGQRLTFLGIAAVIAVVAVILLAGGGDETEPASDSASTPSPTATATADTGGAPAEEATPTPTPTPKPPPLLQAGRERALTFEEGETVRFRLRSEGGDEIHVHGYDITRAVPAGKTVNVSFKADITGIFEIEFHGTGAVIAQLKVVP